MSISVTVTISPVYPGSSGGAIFLGHDVAGKRTRFVAGRDRIFRVPIVGEVWALKGVSRRHAKYGDQVHVEQAILAAPSGRLVVDFLVRHPAFNGLGIGKATARRLWEAFGPDLGAVLDQGDVEKLTGVVSAECGRKLVEVWCAVSEEAGIVAFLDHHGFDLHLANKIRTVPTARLPSCGRIPTGCWPSPPGKRWTAWRARWAWPTTIRAGGSRRWKPACIGGSTPNIR